MRLIHGGPKEEHPEPKTAKDLALYIKNLPRKKICSQNGCQYFYLVPSLLIEKLLAKEN